MFWQKICQNIHKRNIADWLDFKFIKHTLADMFRQIAIIGQRFSGGEKKEEHVAAVKRSETAATCSSSSSRAVPSPP